MNDPLIALKKVETIISDWQEKSDLAPAYFAASKIIIRDLEKHAKENDMIGYTSEKLGNLNWSVDAMFGSDIDNGHSFSDHKSWALGEISTLRGNLCFGVSDG